MYFFTHSSQLIKYETNLKFSIILFDLKSYSKRSWYDMILRKSKIYTQENAWHIKGVQYMSVRKKRP